MKKLLITLVLLIGFGVNAFSEPFYSFEAGSYQYPDSRIGVIEMSLGFRTDLWLFQNEFYGSTRNYLVWGGFSKENLFSAYPFQTIYTIGNRFCFGKNWAFQIEHFCSHRVLTSNNKNDNSVYESNWYKKLGKRQKTTYISIIYTSD